MEYRIEQLARAAGVAIDTIRFYQGKGLLEPPRRDGRITWYSEAHLERLGRIRELQQRGFTLTVIRRFLEGELEASDEALVEAGVPIGSLMEVGADHAAAVEQTARRAVILFDRHVRERIQAEGRSPREAERELLRTFEELLEASGTLVRHHFQRTLLRAAREHIERTNQAC